MLVTRDFAAHDRDRARGGQQRGDHAQVEPEAPLPARKSSGIRAARATLVRPVSLCLSRFRCGLDIRDSVSVVSRLEFQLRRPVVVAVASGKGGVGKTTVAVALSRGLVSAGKRTGLVDADLFGPDVPRMLGLRRDVPAKSVTLARWAKDGDSSETGTLEPVEVNGLCVASAGFLMSGQQGLSVDSAFSGMLLRRLIQGTNWPDLDILVVDLPPGTGEVLRALRGIVGRFSAVVVATPAETSHMDTSRTLSVLRISQTDIIGGIENMAYMECPCCGHRIDMHAPAPQDRTIWAEGVAKLACLPFRVGASLSDADLTPAVSRVITHLTSA